MGKKRALWVIVIFGVTLLFSSIINTPVKHLLRFIQLPAGVQIQGLSGTVLTGKVEVLRVQDLIFKDVAFKFQPGCLLRVSTCYQIHSEDNGLMINIGANLITQAVSIEHSEITLGSDVFQKMPQLLVQPKGDFTIKVESLDYINATVSDLVATVDWLGAGIQGEDQLLGNYHALIETETEKLTIQLNDTDSLLSLNGNIDVNWNGKYKIDLQLESKSSLNRSVISVLEMIAKRSDLNRFAIKRSSVLPPDSMRFLQLMHSKLK